MRGVRTGNLPVTQIDQTVLHFKESAACTDGGYGLMFESGFDIWLVQHGNARAVTHSWIVEIAAWAQQMNLQMIDEPVKTIEAAPWAE
jgi:hypothetical protein